MTTNHLDMNHTRLVILRIIESMFGARNKVLLDSTTLNNSGIKIHGRPVSHFLTTIVDGVQEVLVTTAHSTRSVPITPIRYPIFVRNEGILTKLVENSFLYNRIRIKPIEVLEVNQYNDFKVIPPNSSTKKHVAIDSNAEIPLNLLSITPFHIIVTTKFVPPYLGGDPLEPRRGAIVTIMQLVIPYSKPFRRPLNYFEYKNDSNPDAHVRVFKVIIKTNDEIVDEEITNLFNFTSKENAFD
jgi:hypothetical protein